MEEPPAISLIEPEGTHLVWLDFSKLGLSDRNLEQVSDTQSKKLGCLQGPIYLVQAVRVFSASILLVLAQFYREGLNRLKGSV